jgi:hypothetical protein
LAERDGRDLGWKLRSAGVVEALIGAGIGSSFLPVVTGSWQWFFHEAPPEWAKGALPNLAAAILLSPIFWLITRSARRWTERTHRTAKAKGDRLSVYVAEFGDDEVSRTAHNRVIASIRSEFGPDRVEVVPAGIALHLNPEVSDDFASADALKKARALLKKKHGDLLIWGQMQVLPGMRPQIELHFVTAESDRSRAEPFNFTDRLMLESDFAPEMGAALAAIASAYAATTKDHGRFLVDTLVPVATRLERLTRTIPQSMRPEDRASIQNSYGLVLDVIGSQSGQSVAIISAITSNIPIDYGRKRVPNIIHLWRFRK